MRRVLYKKFITAIYLDIDNGEHEKFGEAWNVNKTKGDTSKSPVTKEGTNTYSDFIHEGRFHSWSLDGSLEDGVVPVAIVELSDGTIDTPYATNVKFIEPYNED